MADSTKNIKIYKDTWTEALNGSGFIYAQNGAKVTFTDGTLPSSDAGGMNFPPHSIVHGLIGKKMFLKTLGVFYSQTVQVTNIYVAT